MRITTCFILFNCWIYDNTILEYPVRYNSTINYGLQTTKVSTTDRRHGRGKSYLQARIPHSTKARSSFQIERIVLSGDIQLNPGPTGKRDPKYPCKECSKGVRANQNAILCAGCNVWSHASCLGLTNLTFKHYLDNPENDWVCRLCSLPFNTTLGADYLHQNSFEALNLSNLHEINIEANSSEYPNDVSNPPETESTIVDVRQINPSEAFIMHLNINSLQNKFEKLKTLNQALQAHILVISETKIDSSYPNSQFALSGYHMYRKDRVKGGGGIITYVSSSVPSRKLTLAKSYKTLEAIAIEVRIGRRYIVCLAVYRPSKQSGKKTLQRNSYVQSVEQEINDLVMWASL